MTASETRAEECFVDMKSIMERVKMGEIGPAIQNDIRRLADSLIVLVSDLERAI